MAMLGLSVSAQTPAPRAKAPVKPVASHASQPHATEASGTLVRQYCLTCHSDKMKAGGLSLVGFDSSRPAANPDVAEKMIRKLRAGMMPPPGTKRPDEATLTAFTASLESRIDEIASINPNPGRRTFQRLNRAEYARSVRDLLALDVDVNAFLPPDTISHGFDNIADVQSFSPTLMEGYLRAASKISSLAVGEKATGPTSATYKVPRTASQMRHVEGAPFGTRGGLSVVHTFPADGEYVFKIMLHSIPTGQLFGSTVRGEQIEVSVNGERKAILELNPRMSEQDPTGMTISTPAVHVKAGPQRVSAAFIQRFEAPVDDLVAPIEHTLADTNIGSGYGITTLPHVRDFTISGPHKVTGVSDTPSRRRIFSCRPTSAAEEATCAAEIVKRLAAQAYRRPVNADDLKGLIAFYDTGRRDGDFESGVRMAVQALLASPHFVFRVEDTPATAKAGQNYRIGDLELASRLSYFLWASSPDAELLKVAGQGTLKTPAILEKQVRRMLADPRSIGLAERFAGQWFRLQDLDKIHPDALLYPSYDATLAAALKRETELFFDNLVREDRPVLDILTADYTFVNERVAKHYGIPNITGTNFRRVTIPAAERRGILGHGSFLASTSIADRTSPVLRGKWVMEVLLGSPPPPPLPGVPPLSDTRAVKDARLLTVRERMEEHRSKPACQSCHRVIDPIGLALENFDVVGMWRIRDGLTPIDASGTLYDGTVLSGPTGLRAAMVRHKDVVLRTFTENLMAYSLGRRLEHFDMPVVRRIVRDAGRDRNRFSSFVAGIVKSPAFRMSRMPDATTVDAAEPPNRSARQH
jgi:hypothetical protein